MLLQQIISDFNIKNNNFLNMNYMKYMPYPSTIQNINPNSVNIQKKQITLLNKKTSREEEKKNKKNLSSNKKPKFLVLKK